MASTHTARPTSPPRDAKSSATLAELLLDQLDGPALAQLAKRLHPYLEGARENGLLRPAEAASRLGIHPKTLTRAAAAGRVAGAVRVGRGWRFQREGLALAPAAGAQPGAHATARRPSRHGGEAAADAIRRGAPEAA
jgi:excisionase family DNA binding protein